MRDVRKNFAGHYVEIQKGQWRKSLLLFGILIVFYYILLGFVALVAVLGLGLLLPGGGLTDGGSWAGFLLITGITAVSVAAFHFFDARRNGARFIRKRLQSAKPDSYDRYHQQFVNTVEEMRLAAGIPRVNSYIIPAFAINSMALIEADGSPSVLVTEGLLAEFTRDEIQAVTAHEVAHILRGDTFYITLVCSLANVFERLRLASEPQDGGPVRPGSPRDAGGGHPLLFAASSISSLIMHLLSTMISRQRELLADAAAVELSRTPAALARAIYKAHVKNSFVGDFNLSYSPLFMVPPESRGDSDNLWARMFNTHPPLMQRIRRLADMIPTAPAKIIEEVYNIHRNRRDARSKLLSSEEKSAPEGSTGTREPDTGEEDGEIKIWSVRLPRGTWQGPCSLSEVLSLRRFTPGLRLRNEQEGIEAPAREFPQIRTALRGQYRGRPIDSSRRNKCPRCRVFLREAFYEGVPVKICPKCEGKLVPSHLVDRIIARKEVDFSDRLKSQAHEFRETFMSNPLRTRKITLQQPSAAVCPDCGTRMLPRPFNYQYIVPVDKCLACYKTWFDTDELEILQILIEGR